MADLALVPKHNPSTKPEPIATIFFSAPNSSIAFVSLIKFTTNVEQLNAL